jgi:hypothetical protein
MKSNIGNMKDEPKPHILGMCETFLNEEKCKMNSRELDLDNFTYNRNGHGISQTYYGNSHSYQ